VTLVESKGKSYHYDKVQQVQQVPEPLPVADEKPDWEGMSLFVTALSALVTAVGGVWGKRKFSKHVEKKRETNPDYLKIRKGK
jgi:hypothetical protein